MILENSDKLEMVSVVSEPVVKYCTTCKEKERIIAMQEEVILLLKEKNETLSKKVEELKTQPESFKKTG